MPFPSQDPPHTPVPSEPAVQSLPRLLGFWTAACIVVGTVIGSGVFKKPQAVAEQIPEFGLAMSAWVLGGLLALIGGMILAEVAVLLPRAGGNYVFLKEAYGRWAGFYKPLLEQDRIRLVKTIGRYQVYEPVN